MLKAVRNSRVKTWAVGVFWLTVSRSGSDVSVPSFVGTPIRRIRLSKYLLSRRHPRDQVVSRFSWPHCALQLRALFIRSIRGLHDEKYCSLAIPSYKYTRTYHKRPLPSLTAPVLPRDLEAPLLGGFRNIPKGPMYLYSRTLGVYIRNSYYDFGKYPL